MRFYPSCYRLNLNLGMKPPALPGPITSFSRWVFYSSGYPSDIPETGDISIKNLLEEDFQEIIFLRTA